MLYLSSLGNAIMTSVEPLITATGGTMSQWPLTGVCCYGDVVVVVIVFFFLFFFFHSA